MHANETQPALDWDKIPDRCALGKVMTKEKSFGSRVGRGTVFLGLLAASYLQYYFVSVYAEIGALPTLVVFASSKVSRSYGCAMQHW